jgi:hypothetical protein
MRRRRISHEQRIAVNAVNQDFAGIRLSILSVLPVPNGAEPFEDSQRVITIGIRQQN